MTYDPGTYQFYADHAHEYARRRHVHSDFLPKLLSQIPPNSNVLELGCGAGVDAAYMQSQGFTITATEGNSALAKIAEQTLGGPVKIMRFDELDADNEFDGVWANMCLLHADWDDLGTIINLIHKSLKPNGVLMASFKKGDGAQRDHLGRYYNLPTLESLAQKFKSAAPWQRFELEMGKAGVGADDQPFQSVWCTAAK